MLDDLARFLQDNGVGTVGTDIFKSWLPDSPVNCVVLYETGGPTPDVDIPTKSPTFQVFVRNQNYVNGKAKLDACRTALQRQLNRNIGTHFYYSIIAISEGGHLGRNPDNGLDEFSSNWQVLTR